MGVVKRDTIRMAHGRVITAKIHVSLNSKIGLNRRLVHTKGHRVSGIEGSISCRIYVTCASLTSILRYDQHPNVQLGNRNNTNRRNIFAMPPYKNTVR